MFRSTAVLICLNAIMAVIALTGFAYSIAVVAMQGKLCIDCLAIPVVWGWTMFGLTLGIVVVSSLAMVAAWKHVKSLLIFMSLFTFITFAASVVITVIILMWSTATDLGALQGVVFSLEAQLKSFLARWALVHPTDWQRIQTNFGCCGVDLKACYDYSNWQTHINTGAACNSTIDTQIGTYISATPSYNDLSPIELNQQISTLNDMNGGSPYFCEGSVKAAAQDYTIIVGVVLGLLSAIQLIVFVLSCYLLCGVKKEDGGFAEVDEETGAIQSPLKAMIHAPAEVASDTRAFANRMSTRIGMNVGPVANRVSTRMGFSPVFSPVSEMTPISGPPPGMPPPGLGRAAGGGKKDFGPQYEKYMRMKKSGLPIGAVRNAMERDQVPIPDGFFDEEAGPDAEFGGGGGGGGGGSFKPPPPPGKKGGFGAPPAGPPPMQAMRNLANRMSTNIQKSTNRMSMNVKGMFGAGGMFSPPPPPPGFGELPPEGSVNAFGGSSSFGGATANPSFAGGGMLSAQTFPEEPMAAAALPPPAKAAPPPKAAKAPKPAKEPKPTKKAAPPAKKAGGGGGGGPSFLADISGGGGPATFGLKKTVTNDRSAPNFNA